MKRDWLLLVFIVVLAFANFKFSQFFFFWGLSEFAHFWGGVFLSVLVKLRWERKSPESFQKSGFWTRCFHISAGAIWWFVFWELFEYSFFSYGVMSAEIYHDTMRDFMMDFLGTFAAAPLLSRG